METKIKILNLEDKELKKMVKSQLKIINQIEKIGKLINDIKDKKFFDIDMIELAKKSNATIKTETIKNINDDSKFSLKLLREIYQFSKGQLFVMSDEKENYLVNIIEEKNPIIDTSSENYKEYIKKANAKYIGNIYQSYDTYINTNYKIEIKNTVLKRIENSF